MASRFKALSKLLITAALAAAGSSANALIIDFYDEGTIFATLTTSGMTTFTLEFGSNNQPGAFINDLSMAGPGGTFTDLSTQTTATASYSATGFTNAGDTYNWFIDFPNPNNPNRLTPGESAKWSIEVTDPNAWNFDLLHINAFDSSGSIKLDGCIRGSAGCGETSTVPEPATLALVGLGLFGAGLARRRGTKKK